MPNTRAQIAAEILAQFPDNTSGAITPAKVRAVVQDIADAAPNLADDGVGITAAAAGVLDAAVAAAAASDATTKANAAQSAATSAAATDATTKANSAQSAATSAAATDATTKANNAQAAAVQRANHTGSQLLSTVSDVTTVGGNIAKLPNPSAVRYLRINADNSITVLDAAGLLSALAGAPLASPTFTGTPLAPTAAANTNTTQLATTAHVFAERSNAATWTNKRLTSRVATVAYAATITPDSDSYDAYNIGALTGNITIANPTGTPTDNQSLKVRMSQDATGSRTYTFGTALVFGTDVTAAMLPSAASSKFEVLFEWNATDSKWRCVGIVRGFA